MRGSKTGGVVPVVVLPGASAGGVVAVAGTPGATAGAGTVAPPTPLALPEGVAVVAAPALPPAGPEGPPACAQTIVADSNTPARPIADRSIAFMAPLRVSIAARLMPGTQRSGCRN